MQVVIDTNIWVSSLFNPGGYPAKVLNAYLNGYFTIVLSEFLLSELEDVLLRPRIARKYGITPQDIGEFKDMLKVNALLVEVTGCVTICRDPDDDALIETAINGMAEALVSRDEDIIRDQKVIAYMKERNIRVLTTQKFLNGLF